MQISLHLECAFRTCFKRSEVFENEQLSSFVCLGIHFPGFSFGLDGSHMEVSSGMCQLLITQVLLLLAVQSEQWLFVVKLPSAALEGGRADFGELCRLHLKTFAYLFLRPRDLGLPHSTAKQLSHCRSGRAAFLRITGIALSSNVSPSCSINCSNN